MFRTVAIVTIPLTRSAPSLSSAYYDHVGIVVADTKAVSQAWADLYGIEVPGFFNNAGPEGNLTVHNVHTDANIFGAYFGCDGHDASELEILQPDLDLPSFWLDHYRQNGNSPFYLGFATDDWREDDLEATSLEFNAEGCPTQQTGYWFNGDGDAQTRGCYHYMNCQDTGFGSNIEVMTRNNCGGALAAARSQSPRQTPRAIPGASPTLHCADMRRAAVVVPDASASAAYYAKAFGVAAPVMQRTHLGHTTYKGEATNATALWAELPLHSGFHLRVYQPAGTEASWWYDGLQRHGPSIHLVSFEVEDLESTLKQLAGRGYGILQRGACYAYVDSLQTLGVVVEVTNCSPDSLHV